MFGCLNWRIVDFESINVISLDPSRTRALGASLLSVTYLNFNPCDMIMAAKLYLNANWYTVY